MQGPIAEASIKDLEKISKKQKSEAKNTRQLHILLDTKVRTRIRLLLKVLIQSI